MKRGPIISHPIETDKLANFYGLGQPLQMRYVRERKRVDYGKAHDDEYDVEYMEKIK